MKKIKSDIYQGKRKITRKHAIQKVGIAALTAASIMFLSTKQSSAGSNLPDTPGDGW
jgi:hypothetical protein